MKIKNIFGNDNQPKEANNDNTKDSLNEKYCRLVAENTSDLIAISKFSLGAEFVYASPSYKRILGYEPSELIGESGFSIIHPDDKKKLMPLLLKYLKMEAQVILGKEQENIYEQLEFRLKNKKGE